MSIPILIMGTPGSGKTFSVKGLDPKSTFILTISGKRLPFKAPAGAFTPMKSWNDTAGNWYESDNINKVLKCIGVVNNLKHIKTLIIDDWQYLLSHEFLRRAPEKGFQKFVDLALNAWETIMDLKQCRDDLSTFVMAHSELDSSGFSRLKTLGKLLNEKMDFEGEFEICLHSRVVDGNYLLQTQQDNMYMARSPFEMFEDTFIPNDLALVNEAVNNFYYK